VISNRGRGRKAPISTACDCLRNEIDKGYEVEKTLLYGDEPVERILDEKFVELCETIMVPLLDQLTHTKAGGSNG
jgi:hypothetical protein